MAYSKKRKARRENMAKALAKRHKKNDTPVSQHENDTVTDEPLVRRESEFSPPSFSRAAALLYKLNCVLHSPRKSGHGHTGCQLNCVTRTRCEAMAMCLRRYLIPPRRTFTQSSMKAAKMAGRGTLWYASQIRRWIRRLMETGKLPAHILGWQNTSAIDDEGVANELRLLLRSKSKYFSAGDLVTILDDPDTREEVGVTRPISMRTAHRWLRKMDYKWKSAPKGQYFDGHERLDVVNYRSNVYLPTWQSIEPFLQAWDDESGLPLPLKLAVGQRQIIVWYHDQTTFMAHDRKKIRWVHTAEHAVPWKKGEGASFGVSDCISEYGYLQSRDGMQTVRRSLFPGQGRDGYWSNSDICEQLEAAITLAKAEFPEQDHIFVYDNAPIHTKKRPSAPSARYMPKFPKEWGVPLEHNNGTKENIRMEDGLFPDRTVQSFYYPDNHPTHPGQFKGMAELLRERGVNTAHLKAQCKDFKCPPTATDCCCRRILYNIFDTNSASPTILEVLAQSLGSQVIFLPKYHCELNPIEQVWGYAKSRYRTYPESNRSADLQANVMKALAEVTTIFMQRYIQRARRFTHAYISGRDGTKAAQWARMTFKRHRTTPEHIPLDQI